MLNDFFQDLTLPMAWDQFLKLPRHPAYRYRYQSDTLTVCGAPKFRHARLDLSENSPLPGREPAGGEVSCFFSKYELQSIAEYDWKSLPETFAAAFSRTYPLASKSDLDRRQAAMTLLDRTRSGADGPLLQAASRLICDRDTGTILGAILITLAPDADPEDFSSDAWKSPAPPDAVETKWGQPHLTWIFVSPEHQRHQLGTVLLRSAASKIRQAGYSHLLSTFLVGDHVSMMWHWKNRFELLNWTNPFNK